MVQLCHSSIALPPSRNSVRSPCASRRTMELWKTVRCNIEISTLGRIRHNGRIMPLSPTGKYARIGRGYLAARINKTTIKAHRLVAEAFIPNPYNLPQVNHKNGITTDNCVSNLEWVTPSTNQIHAIVTGLRVPLYGSRVGTSKLSESDVRRCFTLREKGLSHQHIAKELNVSKRQVGRILRGLAWAHLTKNK